MNIDPHYSKILGLNTKQAKILDALAVQMNISDLSKAVKIPRTSLYSILSTLKRRSLVETIAIGKRKEWLALNSQRVAALIGELYSSIQHTENKPHEKVSIVSSRNTGFILYRGVQNLVRLYGRMLELHKHKRLLILQPNQSTELVLKKFPFKELVKINNFIQNNKIIVEAVLHENAVPHFVESLKRLKSTQETKEMLASVNSRVADTTYIPKELLTFKSELYIMEDVALIMNWEEEVGIEIKNVDMVGMLKQMFAFIKLNGKKVDQNPILQELHRKHS